MNETELLESLRIIGIYVVYSHGETFDALPLRHDEIRNTKESHEECQEFFHNVPG